MVEIWRAQEDQGDDGDDGDEGEDQRVLRETLPILVAAKQEVDHSMVLRVLWPPPVGGSPGWMNALGPHKDPCSADGTAPPSAVNWVAPAGGWHALSAVDDVRPGARPPWSVWVSGGRTFGVGLGSRVRPRHAAATAAVGLPPPWDYRHHGLRSPGRGSAARIGASPDERDEEGDGVSQEEQREDGDDDDDGDDEGELDEVLVVPFPTEPRGELSKGAPHRRGRYSPMTDQMKPMKMKMPAKRPTSAGTPTVLTPRSRLASRPIASAQPTMSRRNR